MTDLSIGTYGESLYQQVQPLHGPDPDGLARDYVGAIAQPVREVDELVRDTPEGVGWSVILDVDDAPVKGLWWLAQLAGVRLRRRRVVTLATNLITNPSVEASLTDITASDVTLTRVANGQATEGLHHAHAVSTINGNAGIVWTAAIPAYEGREYTFAADVILTTKPVRLFIDWWDDLAGTTFLGTSTDSSSGVGRHVMHVVAPEGAGRADVRVEMVGAVIGDEMDVDGGLFQTGTTSGEYFDGDSLNGHWSGAHHLSSSALQRMENDDEWGAYARDAIRRQGGKQRGTADAIISAVEDTLTDTRTVRLRERVSSNPWALQLITRPSETPDVAATLAAALTQKPAGMTLEHVMTEDMIIDEDTFGTIDTAGGTIDTPT